MNGYQLWVGSWCRILKGGVGRNKDDQTAVSCQNLDSVEGLAVKVAVVIVAVFVGLLTLLEWFLRQVWGFGNPLIYIPDRLCGYRLAPNQRVRRFGNYIEINQYSQRNSAIAPLPPPSTLRVLLLGDSVANGGWWTDQADTISARIAQLLSSEEGKAHTINSTSCQPPIPNLQVEVINASANSWGPRNQLGYLQQFGLWGALAVVLLINTDDLFAKIPSSGVVGRDRHYPNCKPPLALVEVWNRYLSPIPAWTELEEHKQESGDIVAFNLAAIRLIHLFATQANSYFLVAMTPLLREIGDRSPRDYEIQARNRLVELAKTEAIIYLDFLPLFNSVQEPASLYRDHIHLSPLGNEFVSKTISQAISEIRNQI